MPSQNQLEIISPTGEIEFYELDPDRGITNIGRHAENDIVLPGPNVPLFYAVLDHRQEPYQIMLLSEEGETTLGRQALSPHVSTAWHTWDTLEVDGYTFMLLEGAAPVRAPEAVEPLPGVAPTPAPGVGAPAPAPTPVAPSAPRPVGLAARPADQDDPVILVELSEREWTIDVDQTAVCQVTIINGGSIVAAFEVYVQGVDESWVEVPVPRVNLNEGERATVSIAITPPRHPSSRAGAHHLAVVVTSPTHPGRSSQQGATLIVNPYYEFAVGELSPKEQTISWRKRVGQAVIPIANKGNGEAPFRIDAQDTEQACGFEFQVPGETVSLARQAEMRLPPEETFAVPMQITPHARRLVGLRKRRHSFTVSTTMLEGQQAPRTVMGQLNSKPLIGPGLIALLLISMVILIVLIFRPSIDTFYAEPSMVLAGTPVALHWEASSFANLNIEGVGKVDGRSGKIEVVPKQDTLYKLKAENFLSRLNAAWFGDAEEALVIVTPVAPFIRVFSADPQDILRGEDVTLRWEVIAADELVLQANGAAETLLSTEHISQRRVAPDRETIYTLIARNRYGEVTDNLTVRVIEPTATPMPTPVIQFFQVQPSEITEGDEVLINWLVSGADTVLIDPIPAANLPFAGPISDAPQQTTLYTLNALNGSAKASQWQQVIVKPAPTDTPTPQKPVIEFFTITPNEVTRGVDDDNIQLAWSVSVSGVGTETIKVDISGPALGTVSNLERKGTLPVTVDETTFFILTAFNGDLSTSQTVEIKVNEPPPTATPEPTLTPTPIPPNIVFFQLAAADSVDDDKVTLLSADPIEYEVVGGTRVNLSWLVQNATRVTLWADGDSLGDQSFEGRQPRTIRNLEERYRLVAENAQGDQDVEEILVTVKQEIPPAPVNVQGEIIADTIVIEWDFEGDENDIDGFRIYRAVLPEGFERAVSIMDPGAREWEDTEDMPPTCGRAYYVVAVYTDFNGDTQETSASANSWYSPSCP